MVDTKDVSKEVINGAVSVAAKYLLLVAIVVALVLGVFFAQQGLDVIKSAAQVILDLAGTVI